MPLTSVLHLHSSAHHSLEINNDEAVARGILDLTRKNTGQVENKDKHQTARKKKNHPVSFFPFVAVYPRVLAGYPRVQELLKGWGSLLAFCICVNPEEA